MSVGQFIADGQNVSVWTHGSGSECCFPKNLPRNVKKNKEMKNSRPFSGIFTQNDHPGSGVPGEGKFYARSFHYVSKHTHTHTQKEGMQDYM